MEMNLQLHHVVSDITGATGMRIIRAIVAGERDPGVLASYRDVRCHSSIETIRAGGRRADCPRHKSDPAAKGALPPEASRRTGVRCPGRAAWRPRYGPDPDPRHRTQPRSEAGGGMRNRSDGLAEREALHLVALPRARQQDLRRQATFVTHSPFLPSGRSTAATGRDHRRAQRHCARRRRRRAPRRWLQGSQSRPTMRCPAAWRRLASALPTRPRPTMPMGPSIAAGSI